MVCTYPLDSETQGTRIGGVFRYQSLVNYIFYIFFAFGVLTAWYTVVWFGASVCPSVCPSVRPSSLSCPGHISETIQRRDLKLGSNERSQLLDVPFGPFDQIRPTGSTQRGPNWPKFQVSGLARAQILQLWFFGPKNKFWGLLIWGVCLSVRLSVRPSVRHRFLVPAISPKLYGVETWN